MAARHGTRRGYNDGCRCDECKDAQRLYQRRYRERRTNGITQTPVVQLPQPELGAGPVESGVTAEIGGLAAAARPGLAATALALARIMDNPRAVNQQPAAARQLVAILAVLSKQAHRRGELAIVKSMTSSGNR
jgi:hypothetical protein